MIEGFKQCRKCKIDKPISEFSKKARNRDGLQSYCKMCNKEYKDKQNGRHIKSKITKNTIKMLNKRYPYIMKRDDIIKEFGRTEAEYNKTFGVNYFLTLERVLRKWNTL